MVKLFAVKKYKKPINNRRNSTQSMRLAINRPFSVYGSASHVFLALVHDIKPYISRKLNHLLLESSFIFSIFRKPRKVSADCTARSMIGYWHDNVDECSRASGSRSTSSERVDDVISFRYDSLTSDIAWVLRACLP